MKMNVEFKHADMLLPVRFSETGETLNMYMGEVQIVTVIKDAEPYEGDYIVTPQANAPVTLPTAQKLLSEDVHVKKIPYYDVSNNQGGSTVYIASEV